MVLSISLQNVNSISLNATSTILSYLYNKPLIISSSISLRLDLPLSSFSNLFKLDSPLLNHKKIDENLVGIFI